MNKWIVAGSIVAGIILLAVASHRPGQTHRRFFSRSAKENQRVSR